MCMQFMFISTSVQAAQKYLFGERKHGKNETRAGSLFLLGESQTSNMLSVVTLIMNIMQAKR